MSQDPGRDNSDELHPKLSWVAEEEAVVSGCIYRFGREKAGR